MVTSTLMSPNRWDFLLQFGIGHSNFQTVCGSKVGRQERQTVLPQDKVTGLVKTRRQTRHLDSSVTSRSSSWTVRGCGGWPGSPPFCIFGTWPLFEVMDVCREGLEWLNCEERFRL